MVKGGRREGAGRPTLDVERLYVTLRRPQIEWLKGKGNASEVLRSLVDRAIEEEGSVHLYEVGKPYTDRKHWPELAQYNYRSGEHELILFFDRPSSKEVQAVRKDPFELALYTAGMQIVLLYRFGQVIPWSDAPYSIHLVSPEQRTLPLPTGSEEQAWLHVVLVDASNGIVRALRSLTMSAEFTQALHQSIRAQADMPFTRANYNGELEALFAEYSSADLASMAQIRYTSKQDR